MDNQLLVTFNKISGFAHLVDNGRKSGQQFGYAQSGACDWISSQIANRLVGRPANSPCVEVMVGSISFIAETDITFSVACLSKLTSAQLVCTVDGVNFLVNQAISVSKGKTVEVMPSGKVNYFYLAFAAEIKASRFHGSVCTVAREHNKQHNNMLGAGKTLTGAVDLPVNPSCYLDKIGLLQHYVDMESEKLFFHYGYQHHNFDWLQKHKFTNGHFFIGNEFGRMGIKLEGPLIKTHRRAMYSEGICLGAIQISAKGQPMVLLNDRQTIGGYPKIGVLGSVDCAKIAQKTSGGLIKFMETDVESLRLRCLYVGSLIEELCTNTHTDVS